MTILYDPWHCSLQSLRSPVSIIGLFPMYVQAQKHWQADSNMKKHWSVREVRGDQDFPRRIRTLKSFLEAKFGECDCSGKGRKEQKSWVGKCHTRAVPSDTKLCRRANHSPFILPVVVACRLEVEVNRQNVEWKKKKYHCYLRCGWRNETLSDEGSYTSTRYSQCRWRSEVCMVSGAGSVLASSSPSIYSSFFHRPSWARPKSP